jgi:hypothetical protein
MTFYVFGVRIFDVEVNFQAFLLQVLVLVIGAEDCNVGCFAQPSRQVGSAPDDLLSVLGVYVESNADLD